MGPMPWPHGCASSGGVATRSSPATQPPAPCLADLCPWPPREVEAPGLRGSGRGLAVLVLTVVSEAGGAPEEVPDRELGPWRACGPFALEGSCSCSCCCCRSLCGARRWPTPLGVLENPYFPSAPSKPLPPLLAPEPPTDKPPEPGTATRVPATPAEAAAGPPDPGSCCCCPDCCCCCLFRVRNSDAPWDNPGFTDPSGWPPSRPPKADWRTRSTGAAPPALPLTAFVGGRGARLGRMFAGFCAPRYSPSFKGWAASFLFPSRSASVGIA